MRKIEDLPDAKIHDHGIVVGSMPNLPKLPPLAKAILERHIAECVAELKPVLGDVTLEAIVRKATFE